MAAALALPGDPAREALLGGRAIPAEQAARLRETRLEALGWLDEPELHRDVALASLQMAQAAPKDSPERGMHLGEARQSLQAALAGAPADTYNWYRLARTEWELGGEAGAVVEPLHLSLLTGPNERSLRLARVGLMLRLGRNGGLDERLADHFAVQVAHAAEEQPSELVRVARAEKGVATVLRALQRHPELWQAWLPYVSERR